jgi:hypothetical protein
MRSRLILNSPLLVLSLAFVVAACEEAQSVAPSPPEVASRPAFGTANGPENPGHSFVLRFDAGVFLYGPGGVPFFLVSVDETQDLAVRHYNAEDIDFCGGSTPEPASEAQQVLTPPGPVVYVWQTGVLPVYVYRLSEVPPTEEVTEQFCNDLKEKWIYRGTHQLLNHDNNQFFDPTRTDAFGWHAQGIVYDRAGGKHAYQESESAVVDPNPFRIIRDDYQLSIR